MRFAPESKHGANAGLDVARGLLEPIKKRHPALSYADLWQFAAVVAIEQMKGPKIAFRPGRVDKTDKDCTPDGRLPDAAQGAQHLRDIFYRMGFNDQEIVALSGAHVLGRCHTTRSGYDGPWTANPTMVCACICVYVCVTVTDCMGLVMGFCFCFLFFVFLNLTTRHVSVFEQLLPRTSREQVDGEKVGRPEAVPGQGAEAHDAAD